MNEKIIIEQSNCNFKTNRIIDNLDSIKGYFEKKNALCSMNEENVYQFYYNERIGGDEKKVSCNINLKEDNAIIKLSTIISDEDSEFEARAVLSNLFSDLGTNLLQGENRYVIRVYGHYYSQKPFNLHHTFKWKNNVNIYSYIVKNRNTIYDIENLTKCPKEQILYCDIEVYAYNLSSARSMAYNLFLEFITLFSVLIDRNIEPISSKENVLLLDQQIYGDNYSFIGTIGSNGFDDSELDILVFDNMTGLIAIDESNKLIKNNYSYIHNNKVSLTHSSENKVLENKFKDREFKKLKNKLKKENINDKISYYDVCPEIVSEHVTFYRKVMAFEKNYEEKYNRFYNACKLYSYAHFMGYKSATIMISYLVASIEALSKTEANDEYQKKCKSDIDRFIQFCKNYSDNDSKDDEKFLRYLYGKIRSGHFHSGEFSFLEYNLNLDLSFSNEFFQQHKIFIDARTKLREIFINWIRKNILVQ